MSADDKGAKDFKKTFQQKLIDEQWNLDNIYNADETSLFWKCLPTQTLVAGHETEAGKSKVPKDRITLNVCANSIGTHKVPLLMIGRYQKPCCLKSIEGLPLYYTAQSESYMDRPHFMQWFATVFIPHVKARKPDPDERYKKNLQLQNDFDAVFIRCEMLGTHLNKFISL